MEKKPSAGKGLSPEKANQLRALLPVLEERMKHFSNDADFAGVAEEVGRLRAAVDKLDETTAFQEVIKSFRNIAEGIVGGAIIELIPDEIKSWAKEHVWREAPPKRKSEAPVCVIIVPLFTEGLRTIDLLFASREPVIVIVAYPDVRVWCRTAFGAYLRLSIQQAWIEYPTGDELLEIRGARFHRLTQKTALAFKADVARIILKLAATPEYKEHYNRAAQRQHRSVQTKERENK